MFRWIILCVSFLTHRFVRHVIVFPWKLKTRRIRSYLNHISNSELYSHTPDIVALVFIPAFRLRFEHISCIYIFLFSIQSIDHYQYSLLLVYLWACSSRIFSSGFQSQKLDLLMIAVCMYFTIFFLFHSILFCSFTEWLLTRTIDK